MGLNGHRRAFSKRDLDRNPKNRYHKDKRTKPTTVSPYEVNLVTAQGSSLSGYFFFCPKRKNTGPCRFSLSKKVPDVSDLPRPWLYAIGRVDSGWLFLQLF